MINKITIENYSTFKNKIELNLEKDNRIKVFPDNVSKNNTLKSAVIYGPNNTGKTAIIQGIKAIKEILTNNLGLILPNLFSKNETSKFNIKFTLEKEIYNYEVHYNLHNFFTYEHFSKIINEKEEIIILKDTQNKKYISKDKALKNAMENSSDNNILIFTLNSSKFPIIEEIKKILTKIANKINIIDMNNISLQKTIDILKNKDNMGTKIVDFIKNADIFLDDYYYDDSNDTLAEYYLQTHQEIKNISSLDQLRMTSSYKGIKIPSIIFDSLGTKKIAALASHIIDALESGNILVIDELDSSLHFKLTRAIISLFNNELNTKAQIICTLHDVSLLDCKHLFRKDQIFFTDKEENNGSILYSLKDFTYAETGIRESSDIIDKYSKGLLGAIPDPDFLNILLEKKNEN